ncbi:SusD-like starch-binding protein associating with outer membrane [Breznakibacter xylanolyticus]|uniref:SusD-like starch-binding protein associating with outer membrane n=1 Tax=Breznakibacter xylanolyticus TaxID=990 RepID=A0A2W7N4T5_9BACT|nr:RagB/SusD family nutrient uptake outer membrane protein [Breznakibacter xylanolyticus]PZX11864.1 SusD-like starch-binding protein associating with outer membrane [Breznakibacter xylanolyticus]
MKKIGYLFIAALMLSSCEDFLLVEPLTQKTSANFPQTAEDAKQMMAGIYTTMNNEQRDCDRSHMFVCEIASDDKLGGGGVNDIKAQGYEAFLSSDPEMLFHTWEASYEGIHRANFAIENLVLLSDAVVSPELKNQYMGEAKFLRAFFYYRLATLFGNVPLKISTPRADLSNATPEAIFAQIASDLKEAIELLPNIPYSTTEDGRVTRWAAQAMMARVWLFYTGFYQKSSLPMVGGGEVTKANVVTWLGDCVTNSKHDLVGDFHELWPYTNSLTVNEYDYTKAYMAKTGKQLKYASDNGARNPETVFALKFSNYTDWDIRKGYGNMYQLYFALRGLQSLNNTFPYSGGWGQGNSIPKGLVDQWQADEPNDIRLWASVLDIEAELPNYSKGQWDFVLESNYWGKKYNGITAKDPKTGEPKHSYAVIMYGSKDNAQLAHGDDLILIRFADVLLMMSELTEDAQYMNRVRARVGLPAVSYSLANLQKERRYELAFEGLRWNDMRRWGDAYAKAALETQIGAPVYNFGEPAVYNGLNPKGYSARYDETKGFFPIPESEIRLANGLIEQIPGFKNGEGKYPGWSN